MERYPFYVRTAASCTIEKIPVSLETVHGASGFDEAGGGAIAAAKLVCRLGAKKIAPVAGNGAGYGNCPPLLVYEAGQGFFTCWLLEYLRREGRIPTKTVVSGRNTLALEAVIHNAAQTAASGSPAPQLAAAADLRLGMEPLAAAAGDGRRYGLIVAFAEMLPKSSLLLTADPAASLWAALPELLKAGGVFIACLNSADAERFDRKKPAGFTRLGDLRRNGFRAVSYRLATGGSAASATILPQG